MTMSANKRAMDYAVKLAALIKKKTVSSGKMTTMSCFAETIDMIKDMFPSLFMRAKAEDIEGNLLIHYRGHNPETLPCLFMNHMDVTDATGDWSVPAFEGIIKEGKLYGRGTLEAKGGLFAMLQAIEELIRDGFVPKGDLYFLSTCDRERDGNGAILMNRVFRERGLHFAMVLDEGGMIIDEPIQGVLGQYGMIGVSEKAMNVIEFTAKGKGGPGYCPEAESPLARLGEFMCDVEKEDVFEGKLPEPVKEMLKRCAKGTKGFKKIAFSHPDMFEESLVRRLKKSGASTAAWVSTTIAFTMAKGSNKESLIPSAAYVLADVRTTHHQNLIDSAAAIGKMAEEYGVLTEIALEGTVIPISDYKGEAFKIIENAITTAYPEVTPVPFVYNGDTDSRYFVDISDNIYRFQPFMVTAKQWQTIHGIDEYINIITLPSGVDCYKYIMKAL